MSVTEQHMGPGRWSLKLSAGTPTDIIDNLKYFGHVMIFPQWFDPDTYTDTQIKSLCGYAGIVMSITTGDEGAPELGGPSIAGWLGTRSRGWIYQNERFYNGDTLTNVFTRTSSRPYGLFYKSGTDLHSLTPGTITDPTSGSGTYTGVHIYQTPRQAMEYVLGLWGKTHGYNMEYRVNPDGTVDIGTASTLFKTTPRTVIYRGVGFAPDFRAALAETMTAEGSGELFAQKVMLMAAGYGSSQVAVASANQTAYPSNVEEKNYIGVANFQHSMVSEPNTTEAAAQRRAQKNLDDLNLV